MSEDTAMPIIEDGGEFSVRAGRRRVRISNPDKVFFPDADLTKGDLLDYYWQISRVLIPHLENRAMVMKRYPDGIAGDHFFMKRTPSGAPDWIECCRIEHASGNLIDFPIVQNAPTLMWLINLGCIDLNPWYSRCDDIDRPDYLNFDLDPVPPADFNAVKRSALAVKQKLDELGAPSYVKTSGSKGIHIYVPIERDLLQKGVWKIAKRIAFELAEAHPELITAQYRIAKRPPGRVLVDYNQNAWGQTLASVYSVRPRPGAPVSAPLEWEEVEGDARLEDFTLQTMPARIQAKGDLWRKLLWNRGRFDLRSIA